MTKKIIRSLIATTCLITFIGFGTASAETLRVGMECTYAPFNFKNEDGKLMGYDVDVAKGVAGLIGAASALSDPAVLEDLSGSIVLIAVPAEEYIEVEYRYGLVKSGELEFMGGKPELIARGEFDDVDIAMMIHTHSRPDENGMASVTESNNGCVVKLVRFIGRAAHAGGSPEMGINALNAALVAINAINALRETFRDEDSIRVHPIITRGGELTVGNAISLA